MKQPSVYLKMRVLGAVDTVEGRTRHERIHHVAALTFLDEEESSCLGLTGVNRPVHLLGIGKCLREADLPITFNVSGAAGCGDSQCDGLTITVRHFDVLLDLPSPCECPSPHAYISYETDDCFGGELKAKSPTSGRSMPVRARVGHCPI